MYPEHAASFQRSKQNVYWRDVNNQRELFNSIATSLNISQPQDWIKVTAKQVIEKGGSTVLSRYGGSLLKGKLHDSTIIYSEIFTKKLRDIIFMLPASQVYLSIVVQSGH